MKEYLVAISSLDIDMDKNFKKGKKMDKKTLRHCASEKFRGMCPRKSSARNIIGRFPKRQDQRSLFVK